MKIFIKNLLFVFVTLITNTKVVLSANVAFLDIQETTTSLSFHKETPKTVFMVIENDWVNRCQNEQGFVAYRSQGAGVADDAAKGGLQYSDDLVRAAQKAYPNLAGKTQLHHITPKYLGGPANGPLIKLDAAYHQQITNAFRRLYGYGQGIIRDPAARQKIVDQVYSVFPLPK